MEKVENSGAPNAYELIRAYYDDFIQEICALLADVDVSLVNLEAEPDNRRHLLRVYTNFHSITGISGFIQQGVLRQLAKSAEELVVSAYVYRPIIGSYIINLLLQSSFFIRRVTQEPQIASEPRFTGEVGQHLGSADQANADIMMELNRDVLQEERIGEILIRQGAIGKAEVDEILSMQEASGGHEKFGEILLRDKRVDAEKVIRAIRMQRSRAAMAEGLTVPVPLYKMNQIISSANGLNSKCREIHDEALLRFGNNDPITTDAGIASENTIELCNMLTELRRVPLQSLFSRLSRSAGSNSAETSRSVQLNVFGGSTEIDRDFAEFLYQPMNEILSLLLSNTAAPLNEKAINSIDIAASNEKDGLHISFVGVGAFDPNTFLIAETYEKIERRLACFGGSMQIENAPGKHASVKLLFPLKEIKL